MQVQEIMSQNPEWVAPNDALCVAAEKMSRLSCGVIPVVENGTVRGIITDRDIVIRAVAKHKDPEKCLIKDFMSNSVASCHKNQSIEQVAKIMEERQIRRLPVIDQNNKLIGIVSLGDIATHINNFKLSGEILEKISEKTARAAA